ncbi:MAG: polysaccharide biosynthesis protein [Candidatus Latescibacterota bacterium]
MEDHPEESVRNNVFGTRTVGQAALRHGTDRFVLISTDKAVHPSSMMGATKEVAELVVQQLARQGRTPFITVRFGNVLRSRGSVIPLFERQIEGGGPVTVTHPGMVRYFMSISEAVRLVLRSGAIGQSGDHPRRGARPAPRRPPLRAPSGGLRLGVLRRRHEPPLPA